MTGSGLVDAWLTINFRPRSQDALKRGQIVRCGACRFVFILASRPPVACRRCQATSIDALHRPAIEKARP